MPRDDENSTLSRDKAKKLAAEIREGEHAARVRDYGEADAATHDARMDEAYRYRAEHSPPPPEPMKAEELERAVDEAEKGWGQPTPSREELFAEQLSQVRDTTRNLIESVMIDTWPRNAAIIDFGLDSQKHYESLYYPIREGEIMPAELDAALGHGKNLTELARNAPSNPHKEVEFSTSWDGIFGRDVPEGAMSEAAKLERTLEGLSGAKATPKTSEYDRLLDEASKRGSGKSPSKEPER